MRSPVPLNQTSAVGIDSRAGTWDGGEVVVTIDEGPLADSLTTYADRPGAETTEQTIDGRPARVVSFQLDDGRYLAAAHFERREREAADLTISVVVTEALGEEAPAQIVGSIEFV